MTAEQPSDQPPLKRSLREYEQTRLSEHMTKVSSQKYLTKWFVLYRRGDPAIKRKVGLSPLLTHFPEEMSLAETIVKSEVGVDQEGKIYHPQWRWTNSISEGANIWTPIQRGRNYQLNPPKTKEYRALNLDEIMKGVDVALRRSEKIWQKYSPGGQEVEKTAAAFSFINEQRQDISKAPKLTEQELKEIQMESALFVHRYGWDRSPVKDKQKVAGMLPKGFTDKRGRGNTLAAASRLFAAELALTRREHGLTEIARKFLADTELLRFEREMTRIHLEQAIGQLSLIQKTAVLADPTFQQKPAEDQLSAAKAVYEELTEISRGFTQNVAVRPYLLGTRKAIEHFGTLHLPEGTISRKLQDKRTKPTVHEYLKQGDFVAAKALLAHCQTFLQKILDVHADYQTVKRFKSSRVEHYE